MNLLPVPMDPISAGLQLGASIIERLFPDPAQQNEAKLALLKMQQDGELAQLTASTQITLAGANIVNTEAQSHSWLASNWRPISMLTFVSLVVARMFGWTAPGISPVEYDHLWNIVELGFGGYVIGRSAEKIVPQVAAVLAGKPVNPASATG
jgi:hypothetical protein